MSYEMCRKCHHWSFDSHNCSCKEFTVIDDQDEEHEYFGRDMEDAAENFAKYYNEGSGEYLLMNEEMIVKVIDGDTIKTFSISAEPYISYITHEVSA